jgi:hypothetical protein
MKEALCHVTPRAADAAVFTRPRGQRGNLRLGERRETSEVVWISLEKFTDRLEKMPDILKTSHAIVRQLPAEMFDGSYKSSLYEKFG